jgi:phage-related protein
MPLISLSHHAWNCAITTPPFDPVKLIFQARRTTNERSGNGETYSRSNVGNDRDCRQWRQVNKDAAVRAKVVRTLGLLRTQQIVPAKFWKKLIGLNLWEVRVEYAGNIYRVLATSAKDNRVLLLHAFQKKSQKTPRQDMEIALKKQKRYFQQHGYLGKTISISSTNKTWRPIPSTPSPVSCLILVKRSHVFGKKRVSRAANSANNSASKRAILRLSKKKRRGHRAGLLETALSFLVQGLARQPKSSRTFRSRSDGFENCGRL